MHRPDARSQRRRAVVQIGDIHRKASPRRRLDRSDGNRDQIPHLAVVEAVIHHAHFPLFHRSRIRAALPGCLVAPHTRRLVDLGAGVPQVDLCGNVPAHRAAVFPQRQPFFVGGEEQIVRLHVHGRKREPVSRCSVEAERVAGPGQQRPRTRRTHRRVESAAAPVAQRLRDILDAHLKGDRPPFRQPGHAMGGDRQLSGRRIPLHIAGRHRIVPATAGQGHSQKCTSDLEEFHKTLLLLRAENETAFSSLVNLLERDHRSITRGF